MDDSNEFTVIPALDLKGDEVVHAKSGNRADYRPIESPYGAAGDPFAIARGLLSHTASPSLYIADLDAIAGVGNHFELVRGLSLALPDTALWIDAGFSDVADCAFWLPLGATLVIGSESLAGVDDWREIHAAFGESVVLSLDFGAAGRKGPHALFDDPSLWPRRVIAMNLSRVGTDSGPDTDGIKSLVGLSNGAAIFAAGGIRDARDLAAIADLRAHGALLATALHRNAVTQKEIAALSRERRS
jgi:HisA/HisF family protein